jgi:hypothetical protein
VKLARSVREFYFGREGKISEDTVPEFMKMLGDAMFYSGTDRIARHLMATSKKVT